MLDNRIFYGVTALVSDRFIPAESQLALPLLTIDAVSLSRSLVRLLLFLLLDAAVGSSRPVRGDTVLAGEWERCLSAGCSVGDRWERCLSAGCSVGDRSERCLSAGCSVGDRSERCLSAGCSVGDRRETPSLTTPAHLQGRPPRVAAPYDKQSSPGRTRRYLHPMGRAPYSAPTDHRSDINTHRSGPPVTLDTNTAQHRPFASNCTFHGSVLETDEREDGVMSRLWKALIYVYLSFGAGPVECSKTFSQSKLRCFPGCCFNLAKHKSNSLLPNLHNETL